MRGPTVLAAAAAMLLAPPLTVASFAQGGSDVPPATAHAAVAGATTNGTLGTSTNLTKAPMNGVGAGGGKATKSGMKLGGQDRNAARTGGKSVIPAP